MSLKAFRAPYWIVICLGVAAFAPRLPAQTAEPTGLDPSRALTQYNIDRWSEDAGLPQNFVSAIAQTPDGYLWLGNEEGLIRFDGVRFTVYTPANTPALSTAWVKALWADPDGTLWVGTGGGGLVRLRDGEFEAFTTHEGLSDDRVRALYRDRAGRLWVGTEGGGLNRFVDGRFEVIDAARGLADDFVFAIAEDAAGAIWVGTAGGLTRLDDDGSRIYTTRDGLTGDRVTALAAGPDGSLWIGTAGGVTRLHDGRFTRYDASDGLTNELINWLYADERGVLWIGTHGGGLNRLHDGRITALTTENGLPGDMVWTIHGGREGSLWLGVVAAGLVRLSDGAFVTYGKPEGLSADIALAVREDRSGALWVGTAGGGVNRLGDGRITTFKAAGGLAHDIVISLAEARNGDIWVGTAVGGISRIRDGRVRTYRAADGVIAGPIAAILEDRAGNLWLGGTGGGLQRWRSGAPDPDNEPAHYTRADGLPDDHVTSLLEDTSGRLWIGTRSGLARLEDERIVRVPIEGAPPVNSIRALHEDVDGTIWIATHGGVVRLRGERLFHFGEAEGMIERETHAITSDRHGYLWLSSNQGIFRVSRHELNDVAEGRRDRVRPQRFGRPDGLRSGEANGGVQPGVWERGDGTIWFPTMAGIATVDPARVEPRPPIPPPVMEQVVAGDSVYLARAALELPPEQRTLEMHFTAPDFFEPGRVHFRYMLEGYDPAWVEAGDRRVAYYTNVPPGRYHFRVQSSDDGERWGEAEGRVDIAIAPFFYETRPFILLCIVALASLVFALHRLRVRRLTAQRQTLLRVVAERERTERALRRSEERLRIALEAGRMGAWEWHIPSGDLSWPPSMEELFGFRPDSPRDAWDRLRSIVAERDSERVDAALDDVLLTLPETFEFDFGLAGPGRDGRHVEVRGRIFFDDSGRPARVAGVAADITTLMQAQEALRQREEELRQSQKMEAVGRLAGGVAHDFNNLLNVIGGNLELALAALPEDSPIREDLEEIGHAGRRAASLTQRLLAFSRKQVLQPRILDLNEVIRGVERMLRRLIREDVALETSLCDGAALIRADASGIEQILVNLVLNAQDAMPDGGRIVISTKVVGDAAEGSPVDAPATTAPHVVLRVTDTGHGMDEETRRQIFEPFFTTKEVGKGTGLGLSMVYGIVQQSAGRITVQSNAGRGTTFTIYLPRVESVPTSEGTYAVSTTVGSNGTETILVVEDEDAVRALARKILVRRGYAVLDAATGQEALELFRRSETEIDLLVSDVVMPGIGGRELAERIARMRPGIRVLFMSGYAEDEVLRRGALDEGIAFIAKPFSPADFARRVREVLDGRPVG